MKESKKRAFLKVAATVVVVPVILLFTIITLLYLPPVQEYATHKLSKAVEAAGNFSLNVGSLRLSFPLKLVVKDFTFSNSGDTIASGKEIATSVSLLPLLRGEVEVNYISLENIHIDTRDLIDGTRIKGDIENFRTVARSIDLATCEANIKQLYLRNADIAVEIGPSTPKEDSTKSAPWLIELQKSNIEQLRLAINTPADTTLITTQVGKFTVNKAIADIAGGKYSIARISLEGGAATYDKGASTPKEAPLQHLLLDNIALEGENISYSPTAYSAHISHLSLAQHEGLNITHGTIEATGDSSGIEVKNIDIQSDKGTYIKGEAQIPFDLAAADSKSKIAVALAAHIDKRDATSLATPAQREQLKHLPDSLFTARIALHGTTDNLKIDTVAILLPTIATIDIKGEAKNINNKQRRATITLNSTIENLTPFTGQRTTAPLVIKGEAEARGTLYYTNLSLAGRGDARLSAFYDEASASYNIKTDAHALDLAATLPSIPLSSLTLRAALSGQGTDIFDKATHYQMLGNIDTLCYNHTHLSNITLSAYQANALSLLSLQSHSPAADLSFVAHTHIDTTLLSTAAQVDIQNIDLSALGASEKPFNIAMNLDIAGSTNLGETHALNITGNNITIETEKKRYTPAPLKIDLATAPTKSHLNAENGTFSLTSSVASGYTSLIEQVAKVQAMIEEARTKEGVTYYATDLEKELPATNIDVECGSNNALSNLLALNGIKFSQASLACSIDTIKGVHLAASIDNLETSTAKADSVRIRVTQEGENIKYFAGARKTAKSEKEEKEQFSATLLGNLCKDTLNTSLSFTGNTKESTTAVSGTTLLQPTKLNIHLRPKALFVGTPITINPDNHITIGKNNAISANFKATDKKGASLHLYTVEDSTAKHDITLELSNIDLHTLTHTLPFTPSIGGTLNSDIHYRSTAAGEMFGGDICGENITYEGTFIGNETAEIVYLPKSNGSHYLSLLLHHDEQEILNLHGDYSKEGTIKGTTTITNLPLHIANAFTKESGLTLDGHIDGELAIDGPLATPNSDGYIKFNAVNIDAPLLGSRLQLTDDKVQIKESKMRFNAFKIYAKGNTPFIINGAIDLTKIANPIFDLKMLARNYALVDAPRQKGSIVYGNLNLNISSTIKGPLNALNIQGTTTILGNSNVTYVVPESTIANTNELDGLVEFVDFKDNTPTKPTQDQETRPSNITMAVTLDIEESAWINADLTPNRSNYISLQGGGKLNMNYNNEEGITLTGRYTLNNGEMKYDIPIIPLKTFSISQGSYIYWTGDAFNPTLDITALERMVTPVNIDGVGSQPVAFDVGLVLGNTLDDMNLSFTMKAPENAVIQDELNTFDAETLNKYAVTMLVTGAYVGSKGGFTVQNALTSFLDAKINDIAGSAMKNVSINVGITDVENSETGGSYMNYSFSFAKRFWNDRLTIIVGGEVNSGDTPDNEESFINNISLEWKVNDSGNRYLRLFYDKNYESILEGEITETGLGYVYKRKLNKLNELLYLKKRSKEPPRKQKEKEKQ